TIMKELRAYSYFWLWLSEAKPRCASVVKIWLRPSLRGVRMFWLNHQAAVRLNPARHKSLNASTALAAVGARLTATSLKFEHFLGRAIGVEDTPSFAETEIEGASNRSSSDLPIPIAIGHM